MLKSVEREQHDVIKESLTKIVGVQWISDNMEELYIYSSDMTEHPPSMPEFVVMPKVTEEIQAIIKIANEFKMPLVPFVAGANVGGLTIPLRGGIILDLKRMDRIIHLNEDNMYVIIEPGVTFGHLNKFLSETPFRYCYPNAPPYVSVMANALLGGLNNLSLKYGCMSEVINGIEAVLPTGELIKIGTCACWDNKDLWWGRGPMPDLLGLFINWQGMTGVVTKMAVQIWPKKPIRDWQVVAAFDLAGTYQLVRNITRMEIADDVLWISAETLKLIIGMPLGEATIMPDDPLPHWYVLIDISANTQKEYEAKIEIIQNEVSELQKVDPRAFQSTIAIAGQMFGNKVLDLQTLPIAIGGLLEYGGCTWVGTYMTTKHDNVVKGVKTAFEIIGKYRFEKCLYTRMMANGHFFAFRFLLRFSKENEEEIERMRKMNKELLETLFELGALPYKTPAWAADALLDKFDQNWVKLLHKVKKTLDPNGIMNPGRWGLDLE
ncbi:MAG: FAD-binding oxidoreductase [Candidatus Helarchaeota archaeon]